MGRLEAWKRLAWKEFRETWLFVLIIMVGALAVMILRYYLGPVNYLVSQNIGGTVMVLIALVVANACSKGDQTRKNQNFLPVGSLARVMVPLASGVLMFGSAGAWTSICFNASRDVIVPAAVVGTASTVSQHLAYAACVWSLIFATTYMVCYFLSMITASWFALVSGLIGFAVMMPLVLQPSIRGWQEFAAQASDAAVFFGILGVGSLVGAICYGVAHRVMPRKRSVASGSLALVLVVLGVWMVDMVHVSHNPASGHSESTDTAIIKSADGSIRVTMESGDHPGGHVATYTNLSKTTPIFKGFGTKPTRLIGIVGRDNIYLAQTQGARYIAVLLWNVPTNSVQTVMRFAPGSRHANAIDGSNWYPFDYGAIGSVSPSRDFALVALRSHFGSGSDIWLLNLSTKMAMVVIPNTGYWTSDIVWTDDRAMLKGMDDITSIDVKTGKVRTTALAPEGGFLSWID